MSIYDEDLAYIHHVGHRQVAEAAAAWLKQYLSRHRVPGGTLLDLASGSGIFAAALADLGRPIVGIDISPDMTRLAKKTAPHARFETRSIYESMLPRSSIVTGIGEGLNYVSDESDLPSLSVTLKRIWHCLRTDGLFVCDLVTGPWRHLVPRRGFALGTDWAVTAETQRTANPSRFERRITTFRRVGSHYRRSHEVHFVQVYERAEVLRKLREAGFKVRTVNAYSESARLPGRTVFVSRKRGDRPR